MPRSCWYTGIQPPSHHTLKISSFNRHMAVKTKMGGFGTNVHFKPNPKKTRQGQSQNTKLSATSRNNKKKKYRGQGRT